MSIINKVTFENMDSLVRQAIFSNDSGIKESARKEIKTAAAERLPLRSIQGLYDAAGKGLYQGVTVPAINIRGITYDVARAVFRAAIKNAVGAFIFEIARSEMGYTGQRPSEYVIAILAAGLREGFKGPVFIQGDHFQISKKGYVADAEREMGTLRALIQESIAAGFCNIDIDASTMVDINQADLNDQQKMNCQLTAELTKYIREIQPKGVTISVGGEIGEVGKKNSTVEDLRAFMLGYRRLLESSEKGISKISVQTGTSHGGVVLPDGSIARIKLDFQTLAELSRIAREEFGLAGAVQHGASTLPDEAFDLFPKSNAAEVHLATGFQNMIFDSAAFPRELKDGIYNYLDRDLAGDREPNETNEQFYYKTRKRAFGKFKAEMWNLPEDNLAQIRQELEDRFSLIFKKLNAIDTVGLVSKYVMK